MRDEEARDLLQRAAHGDAEAAFEYARAASRGEPAVAAPPSPWVVLFSKGPTSSSLVHILEDAHALHADDEDDAFRIAKRCVIALVHHDMGKSSSRRHSAWREMLPQIEAMEPGAAYGWWIKNGLQMGHIGAVLVVKSQRFTGFHDGHPATKLKT